MKESYFVRSTEIVRFDVQSGVISKCGLLAVACTVGRDPDLKLFMRRWNSKRTDFFVTEIEPVS